MGFSQHPNPKEHLVTDHIQTEVTILLWFVWLLTGNQALGVQLQGASSSRSSSTPGEPTPLLLQKTELAAPPPVPTKQELKESYLQLQEGDVEEFVQVFEAKTVLHGRLGITKVGGAGGPVQCQKVAGGGGGETDCEPEAPEGPKQADRLGPTLQLQLTRSAEGLCCP